MAKSAVEIIESIKNKQKLQVEAETEKLREVCIKAVSEMISDGEFQTEVDVSELGLGIPAVTEEMRELGYKFCLIERQDKDGNYQETALRISVSHLK